MLVLFFVFCSSAFCIKENESAYTTLDSLHELNVNENQVYNFNKLGIQFETCVASFPWGRPDGNST